MLWLPSEIVVERFLPTFRALLAAELDDHGLTQQEIANHLGVSQPAVSKYVAGEVELEPLFLEDRRTKETASRLADGLAEGGMSKFDVLAEVMALVRALEDRGPICELHEEELPALQGLGCDLCVRGTDSDALEENEALHRVRRAVRVFKNLEYIERYVPNVGTNIGNALPEPEGVNDVAAVPGRIYTLRESIHVPAGPEFGASEHVSNALLVANRQNPDIRGALNIATKPEFLEAARNLGLEPTRFDAGYEERWLKLENLLEEKGSVPWVVYHEGGYGIEPVTYIYGSDAVDAVERTGEILHALNR